MNPDTVPSRTKTLLDQFESIKKSICIGDAAPCYDRVSSLVYSIRSLRIRVRISDEHSAGTQDIATAAMNELVSLWKTLTLEERQSREDPGLLLHISRIESVRGTGQGELFRGRLTAGGQLVAIKLTEKRRLEHFLSSLPGSGLYPCGKTAPDQLLCFLATHPRFSRERPPIEDPIAEFELLQEIHSLEEGCPQLRHLIKPLHPRVEETTHCLQAAYEYLDCDLLSLIGDESFVKRFAHYSPIERQEAFTQLGRQWLRHALEGVDVLHRHGVAHGDLTLENIMLRREDQQPLPVHMPEHQAAAAAGSATDPGLWEAVVIDLGLASRCDDQGSSWIRADRPLGKRFYLSPEELAAHEHWTAASASASASSQAASSPPSPLVKLNRLRIDSYQLGVVAWMLAHFPINITQRLGWPNTDAAAASVFHHALRNGREETRKNDRWFQQLPEQAFDFVWRAIADREPVPQLLEHPWVKQQQPVAQPGDEPGPCTSSSSSAPVGSLALEKAGGATGGLKTAGVIRTAKDQDFQPLLSAFLQPAPPPPPGSSPSRPVPPPAQFTTASEKEDVVQTRKQLQEADEPSSSSTMSPPPPYFYPAAVRLAPPPPPFLRHKPCPPACFEQLVQASKRRRVCSTTTHTHTSATTSESKDSSSSSSCWTLALTLPPPPAAAAAAAAFSCMPSIWSASATPSSSAAAATGWPSFDDAASSSAPTTTTKPSTAAAAALAGTTTTEGLFIQVPSTMSVSPMSTTTTTF